MKISMWMLHDALGDMIARHNLDDRSKTISLKGAMPYTKRACPAADILYVADGTADGKVSLPEGVCFAVVAGEHSQIYDEGGCQYIVMRGDYNTVLAAVLAVFQKYRDWTSALQEELNGGQNLTRLCRLGSDMLENYTMLYDSDYTVIAGEFSREENVESRYIERSGPFYALSAEALRQLKSSRAFQQTFRQSGAAVCRVDFLPYDVLYVNLGRGNKYEGRLCVTDTRRPFKNGDYQIAEILTEHLRIALKRQAVHTSDESRKFKSFLTQLIDGLAPGEERLQAALTLWHWKRHGRYICIFVPLNAHDTETASDLYLISRLGLTLPGACAVRYKDGIVCVVSLTPKETATTVTEKLEHVLVNLVSNIGVSCECRDFMEIAQFYKQARIASETEIADIWCRYFDDCAMAHYFRYGTSQLPAIHYCDEDVRRLMAYRDARTDYYNTLKVYLENNMNLLETAKALYIHRTTLFNRITKIRSLISANLDCPEDRIRMLISFKLMEMDEMNKGR